MDADMSFENFDAVWKRVTLSGEQPKEREEPASEVKRPLCIVKPRSKSRAVRFLRQG